MTPNERKALLFLAGITLLGSGARALTSDAHAPTRAERTALAEQLDAVDSAKGAGRSHRARQPKPRRGRSGNAQAPVTGMAESAHAAQTPSGPIDVDVADSATIESLPGIGPSMAGRIIADRAAHGAFGSLEGLRQVRGVGPKLAERLAPHVTFSGVPRPPNASGVRGRSRSSRR